MLECENCGWTGYYSELECSDKDDKSNKPISEIKFNMCPDCGCTKFNDWEKRGKYNEMLSL